MPGEVTQKKVAPKGSLKQRQRLESQKKRVPGTAHLHHSRAVPTHRECHVDRHDALLPSLVKPTLRQQLKLPSNLCLLTRTRALADAHAQHPVLHQTLC